MPGTRTRPNAERDVPPSMSLAPVMSRRVFGWMLPGLALAALQTAFFAPLGAVTASALATMNEMTGGRMDLGMGRGDSARRVMGKKPTTVAYLEECCRVVRSLTAGEKITLDGTEIQRDGRFII